MSCCCTSVREGSGGVSYSYEILGVLCPSCEWEAQAEYEQGIEAERRAGLSEAERIAEDIAIRWREAGWRLKAIAGEFGTRTADMPHKPNYHILKGLPF